MAEQLTNGTAAANNTDVEMKEEDTAAEVPPTQSQTQTSQESYARRLHEMLIGFQTSLSSIQQAQDSNPAPSAPTSVNPAMLSNQVEHQSTIQPAPAIATPPAASSANARPGSMPPQPTARPSQPVAHGGPTRQYLNSNITPHLLEGMKRLAVDEPEKPLLWLSNFLREKSKEVEGS
ncbi:hypothetical protein PRZ48_009962 [Zasmidium cellare]|uniref:Dpy-30 domain-containing protein n=1 Tax=Zasmidium cellare TaxID=395010 RepID=A0ABR0EEF2_ZASCE|nr:hypothetical protein PRZ48_009962 [Zasmidium cellare]